MNRLIWRAQSCVLLLGNALDIVIEVCEMLPAECAPFIILKGKIEKYIKLKKENMVEKILPCSLLYYV